MHINTRRLGALCAAVFAYLLLTASSCTVSQPFVGSRTPKLQFLGDSITVQSADDIDAQFGGEYNVAIDAVVGTDTYKQAATAAAEAAKRPQFEIINLGTNDAGRMNAPWTTVVDGQVVTIEPQQTLDDVTGRLDKFAAEFPTSTCVIFVTIDAHNPSWAPQNARAINKHVRGTFAHVVDWDAAWKPDYFAEPDNPHPNEAGRQALVGLEQQAISGCT